MGGWAVWLYAHPERLKPQGWLYRWIYFRFFYKDSDPEPNLSHEQIRHYALGVVFIAIPLTLFSMTELLATYGFIGHVFRQRAGTVALILLGFALFINGLTVWLEYSASIALALLGLLITITMLGILFQTW